MPENDANSVKIEAIDRKKNLNSGRRSFILNLVMIQAIQVQKK